MNFQLSHCFQEENAGGHTGSFTRGSWVTADPFWATARPRTSSKAGPGCALRVSLTLLIEIQCGINGCVLVRATDPRVPGSRAQGGKGEEVRPSQGGTDPGAEIGKGEQGHVHCVPAEAQEPSPSLAQEEARVPPQLVTKSPASRLPAAAPSRRREARRVSKAGRDGSVQHTPPQCSFSTVLWGQHVWGPALLPGGEGWPRAQGYRPVNSAWQGGGKSRCMSCDHPQLPPPPVASGPSRTVIV